jgi:hypothetical protein
VQLNLTGFVETHMDSGRRIAGARTFEFANRMGITGQLKGGFTGILTKNALSNAVTPGSILEDNLRRIQDALRT